MLSAPDQPSAHTERSIFSASSFVIATPLSVMMASVFVTWNTCPFILVSEPPVIVNVDVPLSASPDIDW